MLAVLAALLLLSSIHGFKVHTIDESFLPKLANADKGKIQYNGQYWSYVAELCPDSANDNGRRVRGNPGPLTWARVFTVFTNSSEPVPKILGMFDWSPTHGGYSNKMSFSDNENCGRCGFFRLTEDASSELDRAEFQVFHKHMLPLMREGNLGVEAFIAWGRDSGLVGDNEINYGFDKDMIETNGEKRWYDEVSGTKTRYEQGAIHFKRFRIIGFGNSSDSRDGKNNIKDDSAFVLADVENDCNEVDPKQWIPGHGLYRLMIDGPPIGKPKKSSFWWKNQYYWPITGDYFT